VDPLKEDEKMDLNMLQYKIIDDYKIQRFRLNEKSDLNNRFMVVIFMP